MYFFINGQHISLSNTLIQAFYIKFIELSDAKNHLHSMRIRSELNSEYPFTICSIFISTSLDKCINLKVFLVVFPSLLRKKHGGKYFLQMRELFGSNMWIVFLYI